MAPLGLREHLPVILGCERGQGGKLQALDLDQTVSVAVKDVDVARDAPGCRNCNRSIEEKVIVQAGPDAKAERARPWVATTSGPGTPSKELGRLLRLFPSTVDVPPLRHHIEDVEVLAPFFVARLGYGGQLTCPPDVLQVLMRSNWPGNVEQLLQTMRRVVQHRRTGAIQPRDLPPETRTVSRRLLSPLESLERDAIAAALRDADGNKAKAAKSLGMSRATIYRKIHEFGIVLPGR